MALPAALLVDTLQIVARAPLWLKVLAVGALLVALLAARMWARELSIQTWWWEYRNAGRLGAWFGWIALGALGCAGGLAWWALR